MLRPPRLADEDEPRGDHEQAADHKGRLYRLAQEGDRHRGREERGRPDDDRRAGWACVADGARKEELRRSRRDQAGEGEEGRVPETERRALAVGERRDPRDNGGSGGRNQGSDLSVRGPAVTEAEAQGDGHRPEERRREQREDDCEHGGEGRTYWAASAWRV